MAASPRRAVPVTRDGPQTAQSDIAPLRRAGLFRLLADSLPSADTQPGRLERATGR